MILQARPPRLQTVIVLVEVAGRRLGLPIAVVHDVARVHRSGHGSGWRLHRSSAGPPCRAGMLAVGGRCVPLMDLGERLGQAPPALARRTRSVVVVQAGEHVLGLLVDAVVDFLEAPGAAIVPAAPAGGQHPAIRQVVLLDGQRIELLDAEALLNPPPAASAIRQRH